MTDGIGRLRNRNRKRRSYTVDAVILAGGIIVALAVRHFDPQAEFKTVGLPILAGMVALRLIAFR